MKLAVLRGQGLHKNVIFDRESPFNRDNCYEPYALLKEKFLDLGIEIKTADLFSEREPFFEIHQDVQSTTLSKVNYLLLLENSYVKSVNGMSEEWSKYQRIFTWDDRIVDGHRILKINYPNPINIHPIDGFENRLQFCCLIAGNKALPISDSRDLYVERIKAIRWFEEYAPSDFDLYGTDWDLPPARGGLLGKVERRFFKTLRPFLNLRPFPSYRGKVDHKKNVLTSTRFSICYENVGELPGYITEKIFDCFFSGCIPVYWGANNITAHIPAECFVDRRNFRDTREVYAFLKAMTEPEFRGYQERIAAFLCSDDAYPFSSEFFAETIVSTIVQDLGT